MVGLEKQFCGEKEKKLHELVRITTHSNVTIMNADCHRSFNTERIILRKLCTRCRRSDNRLAVMDAIVCQCTGELIQL